MASAAIATVDRIDLGTLGGAHSYATDVNDPGTVVGWSQNAAGVARAFRWTLAQGMIDLGTLPGDAYSRAVSITNGGEILGVSGRAGDPNGTPVVWAPSGDTTPLPIPFLPGATFRALGDRNARDQVTGSGSGGSLTSPHAWVWDPLAGIHDIQPDIQAELGVSFESYGSDINARGLVVGTYHPTQVCTATRPSPGTCWHAFVWGPLTGIPHDIGIPLGADLTRAQVTGLALNDLGVVVGWTKTHAPSPTEPFLWTDRTGFTVLPTFSAAPNEYGVAMAVNLMGTVVGASKDAQFGAIQAAVWPRAGGIVKLSAGDANPSVAVAVNVLGAVAGWSSLDCCGAATHATLWKLGPGPGADTPTIASGSSSSVVTATAPSEATSAGPIACLSDLDAIVSKQLLMDCVAHRE